MNSTDLRRKWDDLRKQGKFKDAIQTAIEIARVEAASEIEIVRFRSRRPLVLTLQEAAEHYPDRSEQTLRFAEHHCRQMLEIVPDDNWTWDHLRQIRRKLHKGKVYEDRCWKCRMSIDSLVCPRCDRCGYYQCIKCAACLCRFRA